MIINFFKRILNFNFFVIIFCLLILILCIRGNLGNPNVQMLSGIDWSGNGPLELSPERGRFALLYSIAEYKSFKFPVDLARFVAPDVGYSNGNYVSLFAPSVSLISLPGYYVGKYFGMSQVGSFFIISIFALFNFLLIHKLSLSLGANKYAAYLGAFTFLFATPAFTYSTTLYQHHISTFLLLFCIYLLLKYKNFFSLLIAWVLIAFSFTVDYPNFFMMVPIIIWLVTKMFNLENADNYLKVGLSLLKLLSIIGIILPFSLLFWFNHESYGSAFQLSGAVPRATQIDSNGLPVFKKDVNSLDKKFVTRDTTSEVALSFFVNRNITNGMKTFFVSRDRSILFFTPVMLLGFVGYFMSIGREIKYTTFLFSILAINILLYSMWGDPYGGWAFGARYLIPGYAILTIFISLLLTYYKKNVFLIIFFILLTYSICVNTIGALTTSKLPPESEAQALEKKFKIAQPRSYDRNILLLNNNFSSSFVYKNYFNKYINSWDYVAIVIVVLISFSGILVFLLKTGGKK